MSAYTNHFGIVLDLEADKWVLIYPLTWEFGKKGSGHKETVPAGFKTDLATIPWWARIFFRTANVRYAKASAYHDWLLENNWSAIEAAAVFAEMLKADGASRFEYTVMGLAVLTRDK